MTGRDRYSQEDDSIGKLIAKAGPGATASPEAKQRIYAAVHAKWQSEARSSVARASDVAAHGEHSAASRAPRRSSRASSHRTIRASRRYRRFGIAAAVAIGAITLYWLQAPQEQTPTSQDLAQFALIEGNVELLHDGESRQLVSGDVLETIRIGDSLVTLADGRAALRLADNLLLRINVASELLFVSQDEIELLSGTIYIDTGSNSRVSPLQIGTPLGEIEHLGTQYEVYLTDSLLRLRVREGAVAYNGASSVEIGQAGEELNIDTDGLTSRRTVASDDPAWQWATTLATLPQADDYRVGEVLGWVARELGLQIAYSSFATEQRMASQSIVGLEGLNPTETLAVIERTASLNYEITGGQLVLGD